MDPAVAEWLNCKVDEPDLMQVLGSGFGMCAEMTLQPNGANVDVKIRDCDDPSICPLDIAWVTIQFTADGSVYGSGFYVNSRTDAFCKSAVDTLEAHGVLDTRGIFPAVLHLLLTESIREKRITIATPMTLLAVPCPEVNNNRCMPLVRYYESLGFACTDAPYLTRSVAADSVSMAAPSVQVVIDRLATRTQRKLSCLSRSTQPIPHGSTAQCSEWQMW